MRFDSTVTSGNVIQIAIILVGLVYGFAKLESKIEATENQLLLWHNQSEDNQKEFIKAVNEHRAQITSILIFLHKKYPDSDQLPRLGGPLSRAVRQ